jgi:hypothetical protein
MEFRVTLGGSEDNRLAQVAGFKGAPTFRLQFLFFLVESRAWSILSLNARFGPILIQAGTQRSEFRVGFLRRETGLASLFASKYETVQKSKLRDQNITDLSRISLGAKSRCQQTRLSPDSDRR